MDEKDIEMLLALHQTKSITRAAQMLFVNQSSLSKRLQLLERKLKTTLFVRSKQGIRLTNAGEMAYKTAQQIYKLTSDLKATLQQPTTGVQGVLNLGCSIEFAHYKLPQILATYHAANPNVTLNISSDYSRKIYQALLASELDVAIVRGEFVGGVQKRLLTEEGVYLICQSQSDRANLRQIPFINRKTDRYFQEQMDRWLVEQQLLALNHQNIQVDNVTSCVDFVANGLGWAIVPEIALGNFKGYQEKLKFQDGQNFTRKTYLMYKRVTAQLPVFKALQAMLWQNKTGS
ncbi:LysR family transcriptional regulator [Agrilactobacillus composti DSM 18527 = JCM 14202]|uniref:LysR family transcriptional regulator n=1 Tax=Agrilactobacillus composti DSM 18527 = JCM 14202 TaxID=1423734 RepID=X0PN30_9LACO|nr:LysR family transcriptional regulator [Agrilactobacillus composti]KRM30604.1 LysR family transcriptional regulator [Agrilactobacillus composti DSM 18527 = JCM 14202]GAF38316.1 transcriptional regulators, LysR family [Agrilactobacillus composti DSM 18527 = JCM 14202]